MDCTLLDIINAKKNVYHYLRPTPLHHYPTLSSLIGCEAYIKHENHQPVGAFKVRGGLNLAASLSPEEKKGGLFTASTGNHGQSIAYAARAYGIRASIAVPQGANPGKVGAMEAMGATVLVHGKDFDTAREWIMAQAEEQGGYFVGPTDRLLIHGVGTYGLEIMDELPDVDTIIVPVGAGSGVCGTAVAAKAINPEVSIIGVQSAQAPAQQLSWKAGTRVEAGMNTFAEGLATRIPFDNTQELMHHYLDDFVLVDDSEIKKAIRILLQHTHNLAEEAGAAALAAALNMGKELQGRKVVMVMSGGNIALEKLRDVLDTTEFSDGYKE
ncbi:MAG: threonine dehydratase [Thermodesulfobacteriota bacterium]